MTDAPATIAPVQPFPTKTAGLPPASTSEPAPQATSIPSLLPTAAFTSQAAVQTTQAPSPAAANRPVSAVRISEGTIILNVYPYARFLNWTVDAATGVAYASLDRAAYDAAAPKPHPQQFKLLTLENETLSIQLLPELGGRIYQVVYKPTGQGVFYNNPVVKPSHFGPLDNDHNWWLAIGGMEWALPVQEHGYEWGVPWTYRTQSTGDSASVTLRDSDTPNRLQATVTVSLRQGESTWTMAPLLSNVTPRPLRVQFWLNAMLTLGAASLPADTQFILPASSVKVHSTGDERLPGERQTMSWPVAAGINLGQYSSWKNWLGVFAADLNGGTVSAYSAQTKMSIVRKFPAATARGVKLFAFGPQFPDRSYTDDTSQYFELWGGPNKTFWPEDDIPLSPGATLGWTESWTVSTRP